MEIKFNVDKPISEQEATEIKEGLEKLFKELTKPEIKNLVKKVKSNANILKLKMIL